MSNSETREIAIYGWGIVAPGAKNVDAFRTVLERGDTQLTPMDRPEVGRGLFPAGDPDFDFEDYRTWVVSRSGEPKFNQLTSKLGENALFALGATMQAVDSNPGLENVLRALDRDVHVYIGSGVGDLPESYAAHDALTSATRVWNRFWADRSRCAALRAFRDEGRTPHGAPPPVDPATLEVDSEERFVARLAWDAYWARHSDALARFEKAYAEIEKIPVGEDVERGPLHAIKARQKATRTLIDEAGCPTPPWDAVDPRLVWAIQNVPAAQVTMLLNIHGEAWAPVGACSTFGVALRLARDAILRGDAKAVILGSTDPRPDPALVAAFHRARLMPATGEVNRPLTSLLGTHVAGGACIWVIGDVAYMKSQGLEPIGPRVRGVSISSDAEHIITPSAEGPKAAIRDVMSQAHGTPERVATWDLHATGTPGDVSELKLTREFTASCTVLTARKAIFGHGMANAGGWELTALAIGLMDRVALPTGFPLAAMHPALSKQYGDRVAVERRALEPGLGMKVMLGIGGITACVALEAP